MKKIVFKRKVKFGIASIIDYFVFLRLNYRSSKFRQRRPNKMAIFANDLIGNSINVFGVYEKKELDSLLQFLKPLHSFFKNKIALDVGANIGNHTIYFSDFFAQVWSFEPNKSTFKLLQFNLEYLDNATPYDFGLGDVVGNYEIHENLINIGNSSIVEPNKADASYTTSSVRVECLDNLKFDDKEIAFIKIDVEGFEQNVIRGGAKTIAKHQPLIIFEQHKTEFKGATTDSISLLNAMGYKFCWIEQGSQNKSVILKRFKNLTELFTGKKIKFVIGDTIPIKDHSMIIAIPNKFDRILSL